MGISNINDKLFGDIILDENGEVCEGIVLDMENTPEELIYGEGDTEDGKEKNI